MKRSILIVAVLAVACSGSGGDASGQHAALAGHWTYTMAWQPSETRIGLTCVGAMMLEGANDSVIGTWQDLDCGERPDLMGSGTVTGWAADNGHFELVFLWRYQDQDGNWWESLNTAAGRFESLDSLAGTFDGAPADTLAATRFPYD